MSQQVQQSSRVVSTFCIDAPERRRRLGPTVRMQPDSRTFLSNIPNAVAAETVMLAPPSRGGSEALRKHQQLCVDLIGMRRKVRLAMAVRA